MESIQIGSGTLSKRFVNNPKVCPKALKASATRSMGRTPTKRPRSRLCRRFTLASTYATAQNFEHKVQPESPNGSQVQADRRRPVIPDYELLRLIGQGSYGDVWLARGVTGVLRAVKIVWRDRFEEPEPFEREFSGLKAFVAISLNEAYQLAVVHVGQQPEAGLFYYVMELADDSVLGRDIQIEHYDPYTLRKLLAKRGRLPPVECVKLGIELTRALAVLHSRGLIHRDIKPSNIVLVGGVPKLADVGLVASSTEAKSFVGTEGFIPPEGPGTPESDVYSLGKVLYEMATGLNRSQYPRLPVDFSAMAERGAILELNEIILRACDPSPARRYSTAAELLADLTVLQSGKSVRSLHARRRWLQLAGMAAAVMVALAAAGAAFQHFRNGQRTSQTAPDLDASVEPLLRQIETLSSGIFNRNGISAALELARKATELAPASARAWAARAHCEACELQRGWDLSEARKQAVQNNALRALAINHDEPEALLAMALLLSAQGAYSQSETAARHGLAAAPNDPRLWRTLSHAIFKQGRKEEGLSLGQANTRRFPQDPLVHYQLALLYGEANDFGRLEAGLDATLALSPFQDALINKASIAIERHGDLATARSTLDRVAVEDRTEDRVVSLSIALALLERRPERVRDAAALTADTYIHDYVTLSGPKAYWLALAFAEEGKKSSEMEQWHEAERALRSRLGSRAPDGDDRARLAASLARMGRLAEAQSEIAPYEAAAREQPSMQRAALLAVYYASVGDSRHALPYISSALNQWGGLSYPLLRLHPFWDPLRGQPDFDRFLAAGERASLATSAHSSSL